MLERLDGADVKVTLLLCAETAKYIRTASAGQEKTQSKFITDVLERYGRIGQLDMDALHQLLKDLCMNACYHDQGRRMTPDGSAWLAEQVDGAIVQILSIFGIEEAGD